MKTRQPSLILFFSAPLLFILTGCTSEEHMKMIIKCKDGFYSQEYKKTDGNILTRDDYDGFLIPIMNACRAKVDLYLSGKALPYLSMNELGLFINESEMSIHRFKNLYPNKKDMAKNSLNELLPAVNATSKKNNKTDKNLESSQQDEEIYIALDIDIIKKNAINADPKNQYLVGMAFFNGIKVPQDKKEAIFLLNKAADGGYAPAQGKLGMLHILGDVIDKNETKAFELLTLASKGGDINSQLTLAFLYSAGIGTKKDTEKHLFWLKKSAENGLLEGQHNLGLYYFKQKNYTKAVEWLKKPALKGFQDSWPALGISYFSMFDPSINSPNNDKLYFEAFKWIYVSKQLGSYDEETNVRIDFLMFITPLTSDQLKEVKKFTGKIKRVKLLK